MPNADKIAREYGITIMQGSHPASDTLPTMRTWSIRAIEDVYKAGKDKGKPDHLEHVLSILTHGEEGKKMLFAKIIKGVSYWLLKQDVESHEIPFLYDGFTSISLAETVGCAQDHSIDSITKQIGSLISIQMDDALKEVRRNLSAAKGSHDFKPSERTQRTVHRRG